MDDSSIPYVNFTLSFYDLLFFLLNEIHLLGEIYLKRAPKSLVEALGVL